MHRCVFSSWKLVESSLRYLIRKQMDGGELIVCFVFVWLCSDASYTQGKQPSGSSPSFLCCSTRIRRPFFPCLNAVPTRRLSLSLSHPAFRHSDILWHNVENRGTQGSFSFSFFTPNESQRPSPCRERVVYPPLIAVFRGRGGHSGAPFLFFFLCALATSLTFFVLSPQLFSSSARSPDLDER